MIIFFGNIIYSVLLVSRIVLFEMEKGKDFVQFSPMTPPFDRAKRDSV